tara:strand:+ start:61 stop:447 length:387 start_codon:yes stop_codon:yes gene_type:complete
MNNYPIKHGKKWTNEEDTKLIKYTNCNDTININTIANNMNRTEDSIKYRIISKIIFPKFDFINGINDKLYNEYSYISKENIDKYMYKNKKDLTLYYLDQMSQIINKTNSKYKDDLLVNIDKITSLINY